MSRATRFCDIVCIVMGVLTAGIEAGEPPAQMEKSVEKPADFTREANELNSSKFAAPPTKFRQGHVTTRKLDASALSKTEKGYRVQLPSKAPIPTPTVYRGKLYVSGGF